MIKRKKDCLDYLPDRIVDRKNYNQVEMYSTGISFWNSFQKKENLQITRVGDDEYMIFGQWCGGCDGGSSYLTKQEMVDMIWKYRKDINDDEREANEELDKYR